MRYLLAILILGCLSLSPGCYLPLPSLQKRCDAIEGSVVDGHTGQPVKGANVSVLSFTYDAGYKTQTDLDGRYRLGPQYGLLLYTPLLIDVQDGPSTLDIWIDAPGYDTITYHGISLANNETRSRPTRGSSSTEPLVGKFSEGTWHFTPIRLVPQEPAAPSAKPSAP